MQFYSKAALQLIYDQVNRDNPNLPVALSPTNAALANTPDTVSVARYGRNTRVEFTAYPGSGLQGAVTLYYDRINLSTLINFSPTIYPKASMTTPTLMLPTINDALGLTLTADDFAAPGTTLTTPDASIRSTSLTVASTSPAFTGALAFNYQIKSSGYYPRSGPGPKNLLQGNTAMGYFGVTAQADLFTHAELIAAAFLKGTKPTVYSGTEGWYKFFFNSQVIYLPVTPVGNSIAWNTLYNEGLVYGVDGNGKYPATTAVNQLRILGKDTAAEGKFYFRVRLPSAGADPFTNAVSLGSGDYAGSELAMFNYLYNGTWAKLTNAQWGLYCILMNTLTTSSANSKIATLSLASWANIAKTAVDANYYWFPVLELVDTSSSVLGIEGMFGQMDMSLKTIPYNVDNQLNVSVVQPGLPKTIDFQPVPFNTEQSLNISPVVPGAPATVDFRPIPFKAQLYDSTKVDLSTTNGSLDDY